MKKGDKVVIKKSETSSPVKSKLGKFMRRK